MPTYEYECETSGKSFDYFHKSINDEPLKTCPQCGGSVHRMISPGAGFILKGSGFYATDYRKDNKSNAPACGNDTPCCGRDQPCNSSPRRN